ncbi:MAG: hypothetical protein ACK4UJ_03905 [Leptonema sp. (in: bacteria)]
MDTKNQNKIQIKDFLFFDNLAFYYLIQETPVALMAKALKSMDRKLANSILSILTDKQKEILSLAITLEKESSESGQKALEGLSIIAQNLYEKGLIYKKGHYFYGKKKN